MEIACNFVRGWSTASHLSAVFQLRADGEADSYIKILRHYLATLSGMQSS